MNSDLERNKQIVLNFYRLAFNERRPAEAVAQYAGPQYIQHNPEVANGVEGFVAFVTGFTHAHPQLHIDIKRVIAEGDLVVLHFCARLSPEDRGTAGVDIFRLEHGRIVEHWDVLQPIPATSSHDNGMF